MPVRRFPPPWSVEEPGFDRRLANFNFGVAWLAEKLGIPADKPNGGTTLAKPKVAASVSKSIAPELFSWGDDGPPEYENEARRHTYKADLPHGMGVIRLIDLPAEWSRQRELLGLPVN